MLLEDLTRLRHMLDSAQEAVGLSKGKTRVTWIEIVFLTWL